MGAWRRHPDEPHSTSQKYGLPVFEWRLQSDELHSVLAPHARAQDFTMLVGPGWHQLVLECHRAVVAEFPDYELLAIKEKFGSLAFQAFPRPWRPPSRDGTFSAWTDEEDRRLDLLVEAFEEKSGDTCERCGLEGSLRERRKHVLTLCGVCDAQVPA